VRVHEQTQQGRHAFTALCRGLLAGGRGGAV